MEWLDQVREWSVLILSAVIVPLFAMFHNARAEVKDKLERIDRKVSETNGRVGRIETWQDAHKEEDGREFQRMEAFQSTVREELNFLRNKEAG